MARYCTLRRNKFLVDSVTWRENQTLAPIAGGKVRVEEIDYRASRGLDKSLVGTLPMHRFPSLGGFVCQSLHRDQAHIDCGGSQVVLFQEEPISEDNRSVECSLGIASLRGRADPPQFAHSERRSALLCRPTDPDH